MSTSDPVRPHRTVTQYEGAGRGRDDFDEPVGYGWVVFAGAMLLLLATLNGIEGIAAVSGSKFFTPHATYILSGLNTYGWVLIAIAVVQALTAIGVWAQAKGVRW